MRARDNPWFLTPLLGIALAGCVPTAAKRLPGQALLVDDTCVAFGAPEGLQHERVQVGAAAVHSLFPRDSADTLLLRVELDPRPLTLDQATARAQDTWTSDPDLGVSFGAVGVGERPVGRSVWTGHQVPGELLGQPATLDVFVLEQGRCRVVVSALTWDQGHAWPLFQDVLRSLVIVQPSR